MPAPTSADAKAYLTANGQTSEWEDADLGQTFVAEKAAQAARCRVPADGEDWSADLVEALFRRVAANLATRALPLGVKASVDEFGSSIVRVGGLDREVRRLEAPYRRLVVG